MPALLDQLASASNNADYQDGKLMVADWGYDQTNIDFFKIVKRSPTSVLLIEIESKKVRKMDECGTSSMRGTCEPVVPHVEVGKAFRRKLALRDGQIIGCNFESSYGWMKAWDGKPKHYSEYA